MVQNIQGFQGMRQMRPDHGQIQQRLAGLGVPKDIISQGREAVQSYADENGIQLPTPTERQNSIFARKEMQQMRPDHGQIQQRLAGLGIPKDIISQGREAVQVYADENGIQLPTPTERQNSIFARKEMQQMRPDHGQIQQRLAGLGIPKDIISQGREAVQVYADENGIQLPTPTERQNSIFARKEMQQMRPDHGQIQQRLAGLGIPKDIISQGREAVQVYADENGIQLPTPSQKPEFTQGGFPFGEQNTAQLVNNSGLQQIITAILQQLGIQIPETV